MENNECTEGSESRSLDLQPSSEGLGSTSDQLASSDGVIRSALAAATAAAAAAASAASAASAVAASTAKVAALSTKIPRPYSETILTDPSSDLSLPGDPCAGPNFTHTIGRGNLDFEPTYISCVAQDPCTSTDSSPCSPPHDSSSGPIPGSSSSPGRGSGPDIGPGPASDTKPSPSSGPCPGSGSGPVTGPELRNIQENLVPKGTSWSSQSCLEPQKQPSWAFLQVPEPGARGLWKSSKVEGTSNGLPEKLPRGHCLLYNWEEERATNHLDQIPNMQDGSESFSFRHGHQGLLTLQLQSPMASSTTHRDSYHPPGNLCQPLRGKREVMLEMFLHHQICKEVQAEQEPTRKLFEAESVTHRDYQMELVQAGPPAPTQPHDYRQEQPETFWLQRAPQLPGVSNIKTLDTPFRRNCSFTTPVPLSLGQPLPYEPENGPHRLGEMSSLACQRGKAGW